MPTKFCNRPGCPEIVATGERFCQNHRARTYRQQDAARGNATERGYDADWRKFRAWFMSRHPLCSDCLAENRHTFAREVHHIVKVRDAPHLRLVETNCVSLCKPHHSNRTMKGE